MAFDDEVIDAFLSGNQLSKISDSVLMAADRSKAISKMQQVITNGISQGHSYSKVANEINETIGKKLVTKIVKDKKTKVVTKITGQYWKSLQVTQKLGIETKLQLVSVLDAVTREQSAEMDGQISDEEGLFEYPNGVKAIPGNTGYPEYDVNDRETTIEIVEGYSPKNRRIIDIGIVAYKTFKEWSKEKGLTYDGKKWVKA
jgi:uncharacterized protein YoaH (UPF0181 family)